MVRVGETTLKKRLTEFELTEATDHDGPVNVKKDDPTPNLVYPKIQRYILDYCAHIVML